MCSHRWWVVEDKKYSHWKDIENYPDGCIICLKSVSVGCVSSVKKATQIKKIEGHKKDKERIECMDCLLQVIFIFESNLISQFVFLCFTSHCILSGCRGHMPIDPSKLSYCFLTSMAISLTLHVSILFLGSNMTICHIFSYQHSLIRIQWRDTSQFWRHRELTGIHFNLRWRH